MRKSKAKILVVDEGVAFAAGDHQFLFGGSAQVRGVIPEYDARAGLLMRMQLDYNMQQATRDVTFMNRLAQIRKVVAVL